MYEKEYVKDEKGKMSSQQLIMYCWREKGYDPDVIVRCIDGWLCYESYLDYEKDFGNVESNSELGY